MRFEVYYFLDHSPLPFCLYDEQTNYQLRTKVGHIFFEVAMHVQVCKFYQNALLQYVCRLPKRWKKMWAFLLHSDLKHVYQFVYYPH